MTFKKNDGVWETSTSTGTGAMALLGAYSNKYRTFLGAGMSDGDSCHIRIEHQDPTIAEWEECYATYNAAGNTLTRGAVIISSTGSTVAFSAGTKNITNFSPASRMLVGDDNGLVAFPGAPVRKRRVVASGTSTAMAATDHELVINKTVSGAHAVVLPPIVYPGQEAVVRDGKGDVDVGVNNITVTGYGGALIGGEADFVIQAPRERLRVVANEAGGWDFD
jgi:hypothetical protein